MISDSTAMIHPQLEAMALVEGYGWSIARIKVTLPLELLREFGEVLGWSLLLDVRLNVPSH